MSLRIIGDTNFDFIGKRKVSFLLSAILVAIGFFAVAMTWSGRGNSGIEFIGGTAVQGHFDQSVDVGAIRSALEAGGYAEAEIKALTGASLPNSFLVRIKMHPVEGEQVANKLLELLRTAFVGNSFTTDSVNEVGPSVSESLQQDTAWAVFWSLIGILAYIAMRFDFRSGVAAAIATFHDVLAVFGIFYLLDIEVTILVISALLTLAGYSLTDTVVVYDRIRENLAKFRKKSDFVPSINRSINEVLSRTLITSVTVLLVVGVLFVVGGPVVRDFFLALILGVIIGTYSSVFVASPVIVEWENRRPKKFK